jgi:cephalosporin hydroxylase
MNTPTFTELFMAHTGNVSSKWVHYLEVYERYFSPYRSKPCKILEIGVQNGGSLQLYKKYFPFAEKIVGIDIDSKSKNAEADKILSKLDLRQTSTF